MRNGLIIGILAAVAAVSLLIDEKIALLLYLARNSVMNFAMRLVSSGVIMVALFGVFFAFAIFKKRILSFLCGSAGSLFVAELLKMIVARQRPMVDMLVSAGSSWPSSHAAFAFAMAAVLCKALPRYKWLWIVIACVIGFSRLWIGAHYLSDVISGALIGYCIGLFAVWFEEKYAGSY